MAETQIRQDTLSENHLKRQKQDKDDLIAHLDDLLERYLHTLDEYEKVQRQLSEQLSSGFLSLAQANFHNSSSAIRYGQDCYDERMQTIRKVNITDKISAIGTQSYLSMIPEHEGNLKSKIKEADGTSKQQAPQENSPDESTSKTSTFKSAPTPVSEDGTDTNQTSDETKETPSNITNKTDPLRWFGILVPPALRTAQSTFIGAVEGPIPQLATIARDLRNQEIEIGRLRKHLKKM